MTAARMGGVGLAALLCGAAVVALALTSDHGEDHVVWAILGPLVAWSFVGTGLYAWRRRPESRTGALMVLLGFAWCVAALVSSNSRLLYSFSLVAGRTLGRRLPAARDELPVGSAGLGPRPGDRGRGLPDLHRSRRSR